MAGERGSSPHTRGAPGWPPVRPSESRIIPAYAGSTHCVLCDEFDFADHPRIRGEHGSTANMRGFRVGSSPHTRGALRDSGSTSATDGIIPAYAGSTNLQKLAVADAGGSSPHTRGARLRFLRRRRHPRIIPAYAGSTLLGTCRRKPTSDHPRIRGEHVAMATLLKSSPGSSPHTRGARR